MLSGNIRTTELLHPRTHVSNPLFALHFTLCEIKMARTSSSRVRSLIRPFLTSTQPGFSAYDDRGGVLRCGDGVFLQTKRYSLLERTQDSFLVGRHHPASQPRKTARRKELRWPRGRTGVTTAALSL
jgi:hypothetical protein